ncbi:DUF559 domain-containing protein [Hamadaea sp. NPDC051192]|uniref:DUF559 domain-containing protein n=1 Tax=Hamadaea sp. NPDC051192 TaxID=3154940 RepID=UPI003441A896
MPPVAKVPPSLAVAPFRGADAVAAGLLTRRQLAGRAWTRLYRDVYVHADVPLDHRVWCEAAALLLPKGGVISGLSALHLWGVRALDPPERVAVLIGEDDRIVPQSHLVVRRGSVPDRDVTRILGLPVTTPERTAFDLLRYLPRVDAAVCLDALLHQRKVSLSRLTDDVATRRRWPGCRQAEALLAYAEPLAESPMETRLRLLIVDAGLPCPVAQFKIMKGRRFVARVDLAYPEYRIAIEYDGDHHRDRTTHRFDLERQNELHVLGWTVLRFHADDVLRRPAETVAKIRVVLRRACAPVPGPR